MPATMFSLCAIALGASFGAILRWGAGVLWNGLFPLIPLGTLAVNVLGGYLIGLSLSFFAQHPSLSAAWRLLIVTGFLGGLTTFSTFSAEVVALLRNEEYLWGMAVIALHVGGSLAATFLGIATFAIMK